MGPAGMVTRHRKSRPASSRAHAAGDAHIFSRLCLVALLALWMPCHTLLHTPLRHGPVYAGPGDHGPVLHGIRFSPSGTSEHDHLLAPGDCPLCHLRASGGRATGSTSRLTPLIQVLIPRRSLCRTSRLSDVRIDPTRAPPLPIF